MEFNLDAEFEALNNVLADLEKEGLSGRKTSVASESDSLVQQIRKIAESDDVEIVSFSAKVKMSLTAVTISQKVGEEPKSRVQSDSSVSAEKLNSEESSFVEEVCANKYFILIYIQD